MNINTFQLTISAGRIDGYVVRWNPNDQLSALVKDANLDAFHTRTNDGKPLGRVHFGERPVGWVTATPDTTGLNITGTIDDGLTADEGDYYAYGDWRREGETWFLRKIVIGAVASVPSQED